MIYLASPYHHADKDVMEDRFHKVAMATAHLLSKGLIVYSPIAHNHYLAVNFKPPLRIGKGVDKGGFGNASGCEVDGSLWRVKSIYEVADNACAK